jgi:hypothetical protein
MLTATKYARTRHLVAALLAASFPSRGESQFVAPAKLPMPFSVKRTIDLLCDNDGNASKQAKKQSNKAKNNFSAVGPVVELGFADFDSLQKRIDRSPGTFRHRTGNKDGYEGFSRAALRNFLKVKHGNDVSSIGEGSAVVLEAIVMGARHANSWPLGGNGESVNCDSNRMNRSDIHIELVEQIGDIGNSRKRLTAEISPHYRPIVWERFDTHSLTSPHVVDITDINGAKPLRGQPGIKELIGQRVRIHGHLYFDDVHRPCFKSCRLSTWEIHPVYSIDVRDRGKWVTFHEWASSR